MLLGITCPEIWRSWCDQIESNDIILRIHLTTGVECNNELKGCELIVPRLLETRMAAE